MGELGKTAGGEVKEVFYRTRIVTRSPFSRLFRATIATIVFPTFGPSIRKP